VEWIIVSACALLASMLTLFSGFGLGTLLMPVVALFFPLEVAIALTAVVHLANNVFKAYPPPASPRSRSRCAGPARCRRSRRSRARCRRCA